MPKVSNRQKGLIKRMLRNGKSHPYISEVLGVPKRIVQKVQNDLLTSGNWHGLIHWEDTTQDTTTISLGYKDGEYWSDAEWRIYSDGLKYGPKDLQGEEKAIFNGKLVKFSKQELRTYLL